MNCMPMLIVITDGKGNISLDEHKKPKDELMEIGKKVKELSIANSMVIDIEKKRVYAVWYCKRIGKRHECNLLQC